MDLLITPLLTALAPAVIDVIKNRLSSGTIVPKSVDDYVKIREVDAKFFEAMNRDSGASTYPWVDAVQRLQRPAVMVAIFASLLWHGAGSPEWLPELAQHATFYLFGDRTLSYVRAARGSK